jgi:hypothetical protein
VSALAAASGNSQKEMRFAPEHDMAGSTALFVSLCEAFFFFSSRLRAFA